MVCGCGRLAHSGRHVGAALAPTPSQLRFHRNKVHPKPFGVRIQGSEFRSLEFSSSLMSRLYFPLQS